MGLSLASEKTSEEEGHRKGSKSLSMKTIIGGDLMNGGRLKCPECGALNAASLHFCGACGLNLEGAISVETEDPWDRILRKHEKHDDKPGVAWSPAKPQLLGTRILRWIVGPALTIAAFALIIGQVWARALAEMPQDRSSWTYANDLKSAANLSSVGMVAFAILVVFAVYLLARDRQ
jgi:hypothetical protein